jgi:acetolactate synthase I/II/III large subunit
LEGHAGVAAAEALRRHGVEVVFTLSGGHIFPLYDGLVPRHVRLLDTRHEQTAAFAAEGWSKVTRRIGVAAVTAGPGVTNAVSTMANASQSGTPMLVIGGRAPQMRWGAGSLQELDHLPIVSSITRLALTAESGAELAGDIERALLAAQTPHRGPAFVDVPLDVFASPADPPNGAVASVPPRPAPDDDALAQVARLIVEAERPVLMAGADVYWDGAESALQRLAAELRVPVFCNGLGRGTIPANDPHAFSRARSAALREADLVVAVGTPLDFRLRFGDFGAARVVHIAGAPGQLAHHVQLAACASGDLALVLDGITAAAPHVGVRPDHNAWLQSLRATEARLREEEHADLQSDATPIKPSRIYGELLRRLDRDAVVIGDGGDFVSYAGRYVDTYTPGCFLDPGPYGCLGTGAGYAIAARLAHPSRQVVLLLGDGAAGFSLMDFDTMVRHRLPVVAICGNNGIWGLEKHPMRAFFGYDVAADLQQGTRYDEIVRALGGHGELVTEPAQIGPALDRAFAAGVPALLNVLTDPQDAYPRSANLV